MHCHFPPSQTAPDFCSSLKLHSGPSHFQCFSGGSPSRPRLHYLIPLVTCFCFSRRCLCFPPPRPPPNCSQKTTKKPQKKTLRGASVQQSHTAHFHTRIHKTTKHPCVRNLKTTHPSFADCYVTSGRLSLTPPKTFPNSPPPLPPHFFLHYPVEYSFPI